MFGVNVSFGGRTVSCVVVGGGLGSAQVAGVGIESWFPGLLPNPERGAALSHLSLASGWEALVHCEFT